MDFKVEFYQTVDGKKPVKGFLDSLHPKLRAKQGNDLARSLFFFYHEGRIIITNGFVKKTKKTPKSEIDTAKKYREDFYRQEEAK